MWSPIWFTGEDFLFKKKLVSRDLPIIFYIRHDAQTSSYCYIPVHCTYLLYVKSYCIADIFSPDASLAIFGRIYSVFTLRGTTKYFSSMTLYWNGVFAEWQIVLKYTFADKFQIFNTFDMRMRDTTYFFLNGNINFFLHIRIEYFF